MSPSGSSQVRISEPDPVEPQPDPQEVRRSSRLARILARGRSLPPLPDPHDLRAAIADLRAVMDQTPSDGGAEGAGEEDGTADAVPNLPDVLRPDDGAAWSGLPRTEVALARLDAALIVTARRADPAHAAFDVLRAKMSRAMAERGWHRVGITSPTKGCGKTFTALNLALTFARVPSTRTVLVDLDLRQPSLGPLLGVRAEPIAPWLLGQEPSHLQRLVVTGPTAGDAPDGGLAVALNGRPERDAAEILLDPATRQTLASMMDQVRPDMVLVDLPPALAHDDVLASSDLIDCVLIVAAGGQTTARDIQETARRIGPNLPVLGVVLNRGEGRERFDYAY